MDIQIINFIIISLLFSFIFSGVEIAFVSANKLQIELQKKQGAITGKILSLFANQPSRFIGSLLLGNTIAAVVYGIYMTALVEPYLYDALPPFLNNDVTVLILQTLISTFFILILAEFLPKSLFLANPNKMLNFFSFLLIIVYRLFYPIVYIIISLTRLVIVHILKLDYSEEKPAFGLTDLNNYVKSTMQTGDEKQNESEVDTEIFNNALDFQTIKVRDCMIPRTEVVAVDINDDIETLKNTYINSKHSKILVYKETIDDIVGYCHSLALFKKPKNIKSILQNIPIVPETMLIKELLVKMIEERKSLALVVDEFGGTSGIISIEDVIEEIFGEIEDEHDEDNLTEQKIDNKNYLFSARLEIDYLNEKYGLNIPDNGDYDTLGGFVIYHFEDIPQVDEVIHIPPFTFTVVSTIESRIDKLMLTINEEPPE